MTEENPAYLNIMHLKKHKHSDPSTGKHESFKPNWQRHCPNKRRKLFYNLKKILACFYAGTLTILAPLYRLVFNITNKAPQGEDRKRIALLVSRPQDVDLLIGLN